MTNPARVKTALTKWKAKWLTDETRIAVVGCTSEPQEGSKKLFKKFFDKAIYFPFPDYTTRRLMWRTFIENLAKQRMMQEFPLSTLAHISDGYSAGSIKRTCETVLSDFRVSKLDERPLEIKEFIGPLSYCDYNHWESNEEFRNFTDIITGDRLRRKKLMKEQEAGKDEDAARKKKKPKR
jgi:IQ and AAA domain-containing protein